MVPGCWPFKNYWAGVSAEDQQRWDERSEWLRKTPAAVRFVSYEPALGPINFGDLSGIHQIIIGGESGTKARGCNIAWAYSTLAQCRNQNTRFFMKQGGRRPYSVHLNPNNTAQDDEIYTWFKLKNKHGGDPLEWDEKLRVQEFPA
jgi:protein gp37